MKNNGEALCDHANPPKSFLAANGANHSEIPARMGTDSYIATVEHFVLTPP